MQSPVPPLTLHVRRTSFKGEKETTGSYASINYNRAKLHLSELGFFEGKSEGIMMPREDKFALQILQELLDHDLKPPNEKEYVGDLLSFL